MNCLMRTLICPLMPVASRHLQAGQSYCFHRAKSIKLPPNERWLMFRADSIVQDAEAVRAALVPPESCSGRMALLGQSFGGFCCLTYLCMRPQGNASLPPSHPCHPIHPPYFCHCERLAERMSTWLYTGKSITMLQSPLKYQQCYDLPQYEDSG